MFRSSLQLQTKRNNFHSGKTKVSCFLPVVGSCTAARARLSWRPRAACTSIVSGEFVTNVEISLFIQISVTKLQFSRTAAKPQIAELEQPKRHIAARPRTHSHFPPNSQAYPPSSKSIPTFTHILLARKDR